MNRPSRNDRFHVLTPARAYGTLLAVCGVILALGLVLPLALASNASTQSGGSSANGGPLSIRSETVKDAGSFDSGTPTAFDKIPDTAQGVTKHSIKVGVVLLDLSSVASLGLGLPNFSVGLQRAEWNSLFDAINSQGGIDGRKIDPVYADRNSLATSGSESDHAICVNLAVDEKVFAVIGYTYAAGDCASSIYHLPVIFAGSPLEQAIQNSDNLEITLNPALQREMQEWVTAVVNGGLVKGRKVGVVAAADGGSSQLSEAAVVGQFKALGQPVAVSGAVGSVAAIDPLVEQMKSAGVKSVMLVSDFATALQFVAIAQSQDFDPQYLTSDEGALASDGLLSHVESSFNGAIGFTSGDVPPKGQLETPADRACREGYNAIPGVKKVPAGAESALPQICAVEEIFKDALAKAGSNLNPRSFVKAVESLGTIPNLPSVLPGSFGPGKTDYSDELRPERWSTKTESYSAAGPPLELK